MLPLRLQTNNWTKEIFGCFDSFIKSVMIINNFYCFSVSYLKCCETLSFLVRDVVHITPENFSSCVAAIRTFVEASYR